MSNIDPLNHELVLLETEAAGVTIREAAGDDLDALERLAQRDSTRPLLTARPEFGSRDSGPILLAEVGGELRAAYSLSERRVIADPFRRTAELVELLKLRAAHKQPDGRRQAVPTHFRSTAVSNAARA